MANGGTTRNAEKGKLTRRGFLRNSATAGAMLAASPALPRAYAAGSDTIKVGLIGCGGRGTGAAGNSIDSAKGVQLWAMGDLFQDRMDRSHQTLTKKYADREKMDVPAARQFVGWDAYLQVINSGVDVVCMTTPPGFRPMQLAAAVEAGKHVFCEKPVAVDPVGARSVIASSEKAAANGTAVVAGTQFRHHKPCLEVIKRIHDGAIGEIVASQCYYNTGFLWVHERKDEYSDMEWQVRNWLYFTWLSGDHFVEQCIHYVDLMNWGFGGPPAKAYAMGGRSTRKGEKHGNIYDHFTLEFTYPSGAKAHALCRQISNCSRRTGTRIVGTKGSSNIREGVLYDLKGEPTYEFKWPGEAVNPQIQEHTDLIESVRKGEPLNDGRRIAETTLTAVMGRMSAYTGRELSWSWAMNSSKLDLMPKELKFGPLPVRPVAKPGTTQLV